MAMRFRVERWPRAGAFVGWTREERLSIRRFEIFVRNQRRMPSRWTSTVLAKQAIRSRLLSLARRHQAPRNRRASVVGLPEALEGELHLGGRHGPEDG